MNTEILLPELGEGVTEGTVLRWLKSPGDTIERFEPILEIETDKVTTEVTADLPGTLAEIIVEPGSTVDVGTVLGLIESASVQLSDQPATVVHHGTKEEVPAVESIDDLLRAAPRFSPVVRRMAREHHIDLEKIAGTGRDDRVTKRDVLSYLDQRTETLAAHSPSPVASLPREDQVVVPGEILPLTTIRRAIADHMVRSRQTSPHVSTVFEVDFSSVSAHRNQNKRLFAIDGVKLTFTAYLVAAAVQAIKRHPIINSSWHSDGIEIKKQINFGMAVATFDGLIVPVIKNADQKSLLAIAHEVNDLAERARSHQLKPSEVRGGTFTLTNHGVTGSLFASPIINQPQCAIMGAGMIQKRAVVINDAIAIRPMAYVTLTFDHRILDGATADAFMSEFKDRMESWS